MASLRVCLGSARRITPKPPHRPHREQRYGRAKKLGTVSFSTGLVRRCFERPLRRLLESQPHTELRHTMITKILIAVAILIVVLAIVVVLQPSEFRVTRTATVSAPPAVVFDQVNDLHKYQTWSPFAKVDPAMKTTLEGPQAGTGAVLAWAGNSKAGEGRMTLTESRPNELVRFNLEFFKPFKATNIAEFTFKPEGDQTVVTWSMTGKNNFMFKAVGLFMNCDKMVGGMFEEGLANLKTIAEAGTKG
jgi:hypothetical protein